MPLKKIISALAATCLVAQLAIAQEASLKRADAYFETQDYHTASRMFEEVLKENPQSGIAMFKAGVSYLFTARPELGLVYIKQSANLPLEKSPWYHFWLGRAFHLNMKIDSALMEYRKYLAQVGPKDEYREGVQNLIAQAHRTESYFISPDNGPFEAINMGENINSPYTERNALLTADGKLLLYTTRRPLAPDELAGIDGEYSEKIMAAVKRTDGTWEKATPILLPEDRKSYYRALQFIDSDRKLLLFMPGPKGGLFAAEREGNTFKMPYRLNEKIKQSHLALDVCFSQDMKRMVFAMVGMSGDNADIYTSEKDGSGNWKPAKKLPKNINTLEDDLAPVYVDNDQAIIFASKGHVGYGAFDLYKTTLENGKWSEPKNLGLPINGPGNDITFTQGTIGAPRKSFISSARAKGLGEADLYQVNYAQPMSQGKQGQ